MHEYPFAETIDEIDLSKRHLEKNEQMFIMQTYL